MKMSLTKIDEVRDYIGSDGWAVLAEGKGEDGFLDCMSRSGRLVRFLFRAGELVCVQQLNLVLTK
jgi:hypothetical protein